MPSPRTLRVFPMTGVISALPADHRLGGSLENLILKISSRVNTRRCLWGELLSSMIRYRLNVTTVWRKLTFLVPFLDFLIGAVIKRICPGNKKWPCLKIMKFKAFQGSNCIILGIMPCCSRAHFASFVQHKYM